MLNIRGSLYTWYIMPLGVRVSPYSRGNDIEFINNNARILLQDIASTKCVLRK